MTYATTTEALEFMASQCREVAETAEFFSSGFAARITAMEDARAEAVTLGADRAQLMAADELLRAMAECAKVLSNYTLRMHERGDALLGPRVQP